MLFLPTCFNYDSLIEIEERVDTFVVGYDLSVVIIIVIKYFGCPCNECIFQCINVNSKDIESAFHF